MHVARTSFVDMHVSTAELAVAGMPRHSLSPIRRSRPCSGPSLPLIYRCDINLYMIRQFINELCLSTTQARHAQKTAISQWITVRHIDAMKSLHPDPLPDSGNRSGIDAARDRAGVDGSRGVIPAERRARSGRDSRSDHAERAHRLCDTNKTRNVGAKDIIAGRAIFLGGGRAIVMDIAHDLGKPLFGLLKRPTVA